jgi:Leucine-rich repeat (LRR) protein
MCNGDAQPIPKELLGKGMISNNHTFVSFPPFLACKAHSHSRVDRNIVRIPNLSLESEYYEPYSEKMDILMINEQTLKSLPSNLFKIFENLQVLSIMNVDLQETPEFPSGISRCKDLEIVCLSALKGVKKLSKDILSAPALSTFYLHNLPIEKLDIDWPVSATLTSLSLKGLLITEIPKEIGRLAELQELNLDCNPILTLPDELENLKKLKHFSAKGK